MKIFRYFKLFINIFLFLFVSFIGHLIIYNDSIRCKVIKVSNYFFHGFINTLLENKVIYMNGTDLPTEKINIINSNHSYNLDFYIYIYLFKKKMLAYQYSSLSTSSNIGFIDKVVLKQIDACLINPINYQQVQQVYL